MVSVVDRHGGRMLDFHPYLGGVMTQELDMTDRRIALLNHALERAGWSARYVDIDAERLHIRGVFVRMSDGLMVTFDGGEKRASLTAEYPVTHHVLVGRERVRCERVRYELLSRQQYTGVRPAARGLRNYLLDNADRDISLIDRAVRGLFHTKEIL